MSVAVQGESTTAKEVSRVDPVELKPHVCAGIEIANCLSLVANYEGLPQATVLLDLEHKTGSEIFDLGARHKWYGQLGNKPWLAFDDTDDGEHFFLVGLDLR